MEENTAMQTGLLELIAVVFFISLSGVMAPGPLFAAAVSEGRTNRYSGFLISSGHAIVEIPIILILFFFGGLVVFKDLKTVISLVGGSFLIFMAYKEIKSKKTEVGVSSTSIRALITGSAMSLANPYFLMWWMSVGFVLTLKASAFGMLGLVVFIVVHEACDFGWLGFVSYTSNRASEMWNKSQKILSLMSAAIFTVFGIYFLYSGLEELIL
jgi:threonine/homoserine/homoserine lactone efflux protein